MANVLYVMNHVIIVILDKFSITIIKFNLSHTVADLACVLQFYIYFV